MELGVEMVEFWVDLDKKFTVNPSPAQIDMDTVFYQPKISRTVLSTKDYIILDTYLTCTERIEGERIGPRTVV